MLYLAENKSGLWVLSSMGQPVLGYDQESNTPSLKIETDLTGYDFYLDLWYGDGTKAILPLARKTGQLYALIPTSYLIPGRADVQIRGSSGDTVRKSNLIPMMIGTSVNATEELEDVDPDVWEAYLAQVAAIRDEALAAVITVDDTLTQSGQAADAKATGDAINELSKKIEASGSGESYTPTESTWKNEWDGSASYVKNDVVTFGGAAYIATEPSTGYIPDTDGGWALIGPNRILGESGGTGGYYTPAVDSDGNLTWTASQEGMPEVAVANIKGPKGDTGPAGSDGATPVRGLDYWTEEDQAAMVNAVLDALPDGDEVSY